LIYQDPKEFIEVIIDYKILQYGKIILFSRVVTSQARVYFSDIFGEEMVLHDTVRVLGVIFDAKLNFSITSTTAVAGWQSEFQYLKYDAESDCQKRFR